jgi:phospholipid/cholesterol/gamma-HCH transport system substrate-binding protein
MKHANDFIVGTVVLLGAAAIIGGTLWVRQADFGDDRQRVTARFREVGNAQVGNPVVIRGVRAGRIEAMELVPDGWVEVRLSIDPDLTLPTQPVVLLGSASLFGEWQATVLDRSGLPADRAVRQTIEEASAAGDEIPGATLPDIAQLTAVAGRIAGDMASVAERVEVAFDDSAARELRASIHSVADLSGTLANAVRRHSRSLDRMVADLNRGVGSLNKAVAATQTVAERVDASTASGEIQRIVADASHAATQLRATADAVRVLSERVGESHTRLDVIIARSDSIVAKLNDGRGTVGLMLSDSSLYVQTDSLVRQLRDLVGDIRRNPKRYINVRLF